MINVCLPTVSHRFSMYSIQKLRNTLLFLENKKIIEVENMEDNDEDVNQFEEMPLFTNPMKRKTLPRILSSICEKVAKENLDDLSV
jgi:hypothetical protein